MTTELKEPKIKYKRLLNETDKITAQDEVSCMAVHSKLIAVGTNWGHVYILDHMGFLIEKKTNAHSTTINEMSIDEQGNYLATCSDDGKAAVHTICGDNVGNLISFDRPIKAVALSPDFATNQKFITGDDRLTLVGKSILRGPTTQVLHSGEGTIQTIKWNGQFVAWACDIGVRVYDLRESALITLVQRTDTDLRPDLYPCSIVWCDSTNFLIGWGRTVQMCRIVPRSDAPGVSSAGLGLRTSLNLGSGSARDQIRIPRNAVQIVKKFQRPNDFVCGVAPHKSEILVLLYPNLVADAAPTQGIEESSLESSAEGQAAQGQPPPTQTAFVCPKPHIILAEVLAKRYVQKSEDQLATRGYEKLSSNRYRLETVPGENIHFLVSPKDIVRITECDLDSVMDWVLQHELYPRALKLAEEHGKALKNHTVQSVGSRYIEYLLNTKQFDEAAAQCPKVLTKPDSWKTIVLNFSQLNQLQAIAPVLPTSNPCLDKDVYELVLKHFLLTDLSTFLAYLKKWLNDGTSSSPATQIFDCRALIEAVLRERQRQGQPMVALSEQSSQNSEPLDSTHTMTPQEQIYQRALALLYEGEGSHYNALRIYLLLGDRSVFPLIEKHKLYSSALSYAARLILLDKDSALPLLLEHEEAMPVPRVVEQLKNYGDQLPLFLYLDALTSRQSRERKSALPEIYHSLLVELYVKYNRGKLLPFLRSSDHYDLNRALTLCQNEGFNEERIFLLSRMGRKLDALFLILKSLNDIRKAIDFCREENDRDLWERLIQYASEEPRFISELLENTGMDIDPQQLIRKIKPTMEIPDLRNSLVKLLHDYQVQVQLGEGCRKIVFHDLQNMLLRLSRVQHRALGPFVPGKMNCCICGGVCIPESGKIPSHKAPISRPSATAVSPHSADKLSFIIFRCEHIYHVGCYPETEITQCLEC